MDILEETVNQGYALDAFENIHFNMKYKRTPMTFGTIFIGVCLLTNLLFALPVLPALCLCGIAT